MKPFHFKKFSVKQSKEVFRVGTDAVLLGALSNVENAENILEVGTGTGIISLMVAQRNPSAKITALDISEKATDLAAENFESSPFHERLKSVHTDFKDFKNSGLFDHIFSNPPYFEKNGSTKDIVARQQTELSFEEFLAKASKILSKTGQISVIIPIEAEVVFTKIAKGNMLFLHRKVTVYGIKNSKPKRAVLEYGFQEKMPVEQEIFIEETPRVYSAAYLKLTEDFHLFGR